MRNLLTVLGLGLALTAARAQEKPPLPQPVKEGNLERLILDDGTEQDAATWSPAEATVAVDKQHARHGETALRLHIAVDWKTGEPNYPIGWPRTNRHFPEGLQDWSSWDYLEFSVYTQATRDKLPPVPLGLGIYGAGDRSDYDRELTELKLGQWTDYRLPLSALPSLNPRTGLQFWISESNYRDGDVLDFWIDRISLVRYVGPTLTASHLAEQAVFADSRYLLLGLDMMGVKPGQTAVVTWALTRDGRTAAQGQLAAGRGSSRVALPLPGRGLAPGEYELALKCQGETPAPFRVKVASSPWQEGSK
jgi:hypothetical protein